MLGSIKENWRLILLVIFVAAALFALFVPGGVFGDEGGTDAVEETEDDAVEEGLTNLEYGLGLDGGTRISAPVVGMTAEDIDSGAIDEEEGVIDEQRLGEIETTVQDDLELAAADVRVGYHEDDNAVHAEVFSEEVDESEFVDALAAADVDYDAGDVRDGVTDETRAEIVSTLELRINEAGLSGGQATERAAVGGEHFVVVEVPDMGEEELRELISERGVVEIWAYHPDENGEQVNETVLTGEEIADVDPPRASEEGDGYEVPVEVEPDAAPAFQDRMNDLEFTTTGQGQCALRGDGETINFDHDDPQYCLLTVSDGEPVDAHSMGPRLADNMHGGDWEHSPSFFMGAQSQTQAHSLSVDLRAGSLPAPIDLSPQSSQTFSITPALADQFKLYSLFIGVLSVLAVSGMVYLRYSDARVAAPMIITALAEVVILLGFAAAIRMPLDLSHVAGFIAVVGTGVDDLIVIADEVMSEGEVNQQKIFDSRFRKAFWVIGAAAATTIVAMSPLAVLSGLGDLRGFAIITILGVLIGVLVTRPAYGDILRHLLTGDK
ncbi:preprotein translocase subunit SecD [Natrialbaceae archaeon AArc-T1-2]|uniref:preprotein translocase subunit SecD n=1 Tax=Natrialbaceae archaeon AArc-T1-2 TaxID=3053904 RepID=UPI00255B10FE|nr:preprotein translocase subunit SecD [Natrialbaceae archaeon AArc-T1-2]WIV66808.1 preprotein translocase subunit SecD [Natrialbaceae archaeon AArc-T1-2]